VHAFDAHASARYVRHRLDCAGARPELFAESAIELIHQESGGVPRLINHIADNALLFAYAAKAQHVNEHLVREAMRETMNLLPPSSKDPPRVAGTAATGARGAAGATWDTALLRGVAVGSVEGELSSMARSFEKISEQQSGLSTSLDSAVSKLACGQDDIRRRMKALRAG
jgi:hypothetical protein